MPHVLVQLQYFTLLEGEWFLFMKPTLVIQICKANEGYSFQQQQQHLCIVSFIQESHEVQLEERANSCTWGGRTPGTCTHWRPPRWIVGWQRRTWGANNVCLWQRRWVVPWAALGKVLPSGWGMWSFPFTSTDEATPGVLGPVLSSLVQERHRHIDSV